MTVRRRGFIGQNLIPPMKSHLTASRSLLVLACASLAFAAPAQRGPNANRPADCPAGDGSCAAATTDTTPLALSAPAKTALLFQIDEERMARELYTAFGAKWELRPFANIPQSETNHEAMLRQLATRAGLKLPSSVAGRFDDVEVQKRYDDLLALGLQSADSALRVGAYVEEVDIADLNTLLGTTDSTALKTVATALKTASGHHLNAFVGLLQTRGITYAPQVLKVEDYQAILASGSGGHGRGRGSAQGQGQGRGWGRGPGRA